jgi:NADH-quinone oxidoreductase subunit J
MLLNLRPEAKRPRSGMVQGALGFLLALALAGMLGLVMARGFASEGFTTPSEGFGTAGALGLDLFSRFFYPFEAVSLLLIVAMIGAVLLAKRRL